MTALVAPKQVRKTSATFLRLTLTATKKAYEGGLACLVSGKLVPGASASGQKIVGFFAETVDATSSGPLGAVDQPCNVDLVDEVSILWRANDGTITSANVGASCYISDDNTVSLNSTTQSVAGTIVQVDATYGVGFVKGGL